MRCTVLLVALVATVSAIPSYLDTQECTKCSPCLKDNDYKVPVSDVCSYCHCSPDQTPTLEKCPFGTEYDATVDDCVPSTRCGDPRCESYCEACYHDIKFNSTDPCGYCECKNNGLMEYHHCPEGTGWENYECVPKAECSVNPMCNASLWVPCYIDMGIKFPSFDPCGYCEVTSGGMEYHHCPAGTGWDHYECVPKDECCHTDGCSKYTCPPCYHGMRLRFPNPYDTCGFCCCESVDGSSVEVPIPMECPEDMVFDPEVSNCVYQENRVCHKKEECCNGCADIECPPCYHGMRLRFPDPYDSCGFCCCEPETGNSTHEIAVPKKCPEDMVFDPDQNNCVYEPNRVCHKKECFTTTHTLPTITTPKTCPTPPPNCDVTCPPEHYGERWLMANPVDPCSFCCCEPDGTGNEIPHFKTCWEHDQYFDPVDKVCKRNGTICPRPPPDHHEDCRNPSDKDGCHLMVSLCDYDADGHLPNPYDDRSFCQCDHENIHWMPCPPGTVRFIDSAGACV
ncbi:hypothetical protein J437_LFUL009222 [Ladona fulva]|uniref:Chitin-binding type-2 domain-containing protein n=1 Tax=Ladona fulva TaxID=123851 RepID=A0A8K0K7G7_LADFU|nr:hypothetical protein J437_LFUL009222 [Ladona fulva]